MRFLFVCLMAALPLRGATFTVTNSNNSGAGSLRQAITDANATAAADTIVFNTAGHFSVARTITVTSELIVSNSVTINAPAAAGQRVTVSGGGSTRVVRDVMQAAGMIALRNLTIRDGVSTGAGGGISLEGLDTTLELDNCTVTACRAALEGGGIYGLRIAEVRLINSTLSLNTAEDGGGLYVTDSNVAHVIITGGFITGNMTTGEPALSGNGAGVQIDYGSLQMTGVQLSLNVASSRGGALYGGTGTIENCLFSGNVADSGGGAVYLTGAGYTFRNCTFSANRTTDGDGGALAAVDPGYAAARADLHHCTFVGNNAGGTGGGLHCSGLQARLTAVNCTVSGNTAGAGGGVYGSGTVELRNCTITGNASGLSGGGIVSSGTGTFAIGNCIVAGNTAGTQGPDYAASLGFASDGSEVRGSFTSLGHNFVGIRTSAYSDLENRVNGDRVGSAAAPLDPMLGPLASNGGTTQTHALLTGSPAVDAGDTALITDPPFTGPSFTDQHGRPRVEGSSVDIGAVEQAVLEVTTLSDSGAGSLRDIITQANAVGGGTIGLKRSVFASARQTITLTSGQIPVTTSITITAPEVGVTISGNNNSRVFNITGGAVVSLEGFHLVDGNSTAEGGAVRVNGAATRLLLKSGSISGSDAVGGGGLLVENGTAQVTDSFLKGNTATTGGGGAIKVTGNGTLRLTNSTVTLNTSNTSGGGLFQDTGTTTLINATFAANTADADNNNSGNGGGLFQSGGTVSLGNTIVAGNLDLSSGTSHPDYSGTFSTLGHNLIGITQGGAGLVNGANGDLAGNTGAPLNARLTAGGGTTWYVPQVTSPAVNAGDNALLGRNAWPAVPARDQRGQFRVVNSAVDIGAVEGPLEAVVTLAVDDAAGSERGQSQAKFRLTRSLTTGSLAVTFTVDGTSTAAPADYVLSGPSYTAGPHTLVFADGEESILLRVTPQDDSVEEGTETLTISLTGAGYVIDPGAGITQTVSILDDEFLVSSNASSGPGSLRDAIKQCSDFGGGKITLTPGMNITLRGSALPVTGATEIIGNVSTVSAAGRSRVFEIAGDGVDTVKLQGLIIAGGTTVVDGGGIHIDGAAVEIRGCALTLNHAGDRGGAIFARGRALLNVVNCSIHDNDATIGGGISAGTELALTNTTIARNGAEGGGGGLYFHGSGETATMTNCTFAENRADTDPTGSFDQGGGAVYCPQGTVLFRNTAVSGNIDATPPGTGATHHHLRVAGGTFLTGGGNFFADNTGVAGLATGLPNANFDYVPTLAAPLNPRLLAVPDLRPFYAFPSASILTNNGRNGVNTEPSDQRGKPRASGGGIDIGAFELSGFSVTQAGGTGNGSLSGAVASANLAGGGDIVFDPVALSAGAVFAGGELTISAPMDFMAPRRGGALSVQVGGLANARVFKVSPPAAAAVTFRNLRMAGGNVGANAAGDRNGGALVVSGNAAVSLLGCELGGGTSPVDGGLVHVASGGSLTARDSSFRSGTANRGGGIYSSGSVVLERCTLDANISTGNGGGLNATGPATLVNCTFFGNRANAAGGGIFCAAPGSTTLSLHHCSLTQNVCNADNTGSEPGSAIRQLSGIVRLRNCVLSGNREDLAAGGRDADIEGAFVSDGFNLVSDRGTATGFTHGANGDRVGSTAAPLTEAFSALTENGGPTRTLRLSCNALSRDAGDDAGAPATDQRGLLRRHGIGVDLGAYELQPESYEFWVGYRFTPTDTATRRGDDADGDGLTNEIEYATGTDPRQSGSLPVIAVTVIGSQTLVDYPVSSTAEPGYLRLRTSADLVAWNNVLSTPVLLNCGPATPQEIWRVSIAAPVTVRRFFRLEK